MSGAAAGYSGKPVWQKLGLAAERRVLVRHAPSDYAALVGMPPPLLRLVGPRAAFDLAHVFVTTRAQLAAELAALDARLPDDGTIWVSWPKKSSGVATDVVEDAVREVALPLGLVDVKVCAVDATWSGLKLVRRRERRGPR
ncbi:DUF3052 family protein [Dokdonella fugitiva]|jgi:hypothetical protein|uniref:DUF3052 family protein n=1 Tax=Dokdonella fugitiva TaxID=328517 RepID=A0A4R2IE02_9GAMM|nr:DUF3052 family protein [Dokdonella fugitiva]MBA8882359.1 hypothetical protein [Dokdonella fugitiva]TCO42834.1 DUF3052 family protein [Dokdonella fugitiva]